jgi:catechol 2,3-dioxygenase-like lactoylglutathione lyase family enzyme
MVRQQITVEGMDHIGVRVHDLDRTLAFYRALGFDLLRRAENDDVAIIRNAHGVELNIVFNANGGDPSTNILMDIADNIGAAFTLGRAVAAGMKQAGSGRIINISSEAGLGPLPDWHPGILLSKTRSCRA